MLRRQARLRREYLYNTVTKRRQQEAASKRAKLEELVANNKSIGSMFGNKSVQMYNDEKYEYEDSKLLIRLSQNLTSFSQQFFLNLIRCRPS